MYGKAGRVAADPIRRANILLKKAGTRASEGAYSAAVRDITLGRALVTNLEGTRAAKPPAPDWRPSLPGCASSNSVRGPR